MNQVLKNQTLSLGLSTEWHWPESNSDYQHFRQNKPRFPFLCQDFSLWEKDQDITRRMGSCIWSLVHNEPFVSLTKRMQRMNLFTGVFQHTLEFPDDLFKIGILNCYLKCLDGLLHLSLLVDWFRFGVCAGGVVWRFVSPYVGYICSSMQNFSPMSR
jgi:hypothetical protein